MFTKILISNRGEIACRIIRTARKMGIATVAVYSEADRNALHVKLADEAVCIGPAPATQSYLSIDKIVAACLATGAEAVHPGYGFLSEQVAFAEALGKAGITFIGPQPDAIAAMGDKIVSKKVAAAAGVSTVPGHPEAISTPDEAVAVADAIGYPVMIKASAGGGGKGMRIAFNDTETRDGFVRARSEAASSFGDDRIFIEKFIREPRHIEIQVLGDKHGNVIHLGERECSIQRRNQKVLEEAPSPLLDETTRRRMGEQAVALAKSVGYDSAGTVEFVVGQDKSFYFLEMNTRLQVEHPVTEFVTGLDLVEEMIRAAAGEPLRLRQEDVRLTGWAVESRIYAEDPAQGFLPSTGRLLLFRSPEESLIATAALRIDTGVEEGGTIPVYYDPLIAKLITCAPTRLEAIEAQAAALDAFAIDGVRTNLSFLSALMHLPRWREGRLSTALIAEEFGSSAPPSLPQGDMLRDVAAVSAALHYRGAAIRHSRPGRQPLPAKGEPFSLTLEGRDRIENFEIVATSNGDGVTVTFADGLTVDVESDWQPPEPTFAGRIDGRVLACQVRMENGRIIVDHAGTRAISKALSREAARLSPFMRSRAADAARAKVISPMPGLLNDLLVSVGDEVVTGQVLAVVEAMKMEISIRAEINGRVAEVFLKPGTMIDSTVALLQIET